jgi:methionyl-tRNA formyltransferase
LDAAGREVHNHIRGLSPSPGAWCEFPSAAHERIRILKSQMAEGAGRPGVVLSARAAGDRLRTGAIQIFGVQRAGKKPVAAPNSCAARGSATPVLGERVGIWG